MGKVDNNLASLIGDVKTQTSRVQDSKTNGVEQAAAPKAKPAAPKKGATKAASQKVQNSKTSKPAETLRAGEGSSPKYASLVPKEARLREDQIAALNDLARTLGRNRSDKTERITSNTLIRIAIDHLLANRDNMAGETEEQLRTSYLKP